MPLDTSKLQNPRRAPNGSTTYACPCCREDLGRDKTGNHLIVYSDGRFGCAAYPNDTQHRARIWALAGDGSSIDSAERPARPLPQITLPTVYSPDLLDRLIKDYSYWEGRGISAGTVAPFHGGIATQGQMANRWVFPQYNERGEIIGFSGRCLRTMTREERKRFNRPAWKHLTPSSHFVWGGLDEIEEAGRVILVESIGDSLKLRENGVPETLVLFGTAMSEAVLGKLISLSPREIIVSTNNEPEHRSGKNVGAVAATKIEATLLKFWNREKIRVSLPPYEGVKDWGECTPEQIEKWKNSLDTTPNTDTVA